MGWASGCSWRPRIVHEPELLVLDEPFAGLDPTAVEFLSRVVLEQVSAGRNLVLSSHQLDLVEDICESITLLHHGRVVLSGEVAQLKAASPHRYLRVDVAVDEAWLARAPVTVDRREPTGTRLRLEPGADAGAVLDLIRSRAAVHDFGVDAADALGAVPGRHRCIVGRARAWPDAERLGVRQVLRQGWSGRRTGRRPRSPVLMTDLQAARLVVAREVREALRRKAPWITSAVVLLGSIALMVVPSLIGGGSDTSTVAVAGGPAPAVRAGGRAVGRGGRRPGAAHGGDQPRRGATGGGRRPRRRRRRHRLRQRRRRPAVPHLCRARGRPDRRHRPPGPGGRVDDSRVAAAGLDDSQIAAALSAPAPQLEAVGDDRGGRIAAATVVSLTVYLLLFMVTAQVANGVAIEKSNRVSEVLLAIAPPRSLFAGKVVGVGLIGLLPLVCGALPVVVRLVAGGRDLPPDTGAAVAGGAAWFILGAGFYLSAAGGLGALVERQEEVGSAMAGLSIALVGSYVIGQSAADSSLGLVLAILPFSSPMVEPARLALGVSSPVEVVTSLAVGVVSLVLIVRLATAIYERAVVRTGRRLHLRDVLRPAATS